MQAGPGQAPSSPLTQADVTVPSWAGPYRMLTATGPLRFPPEDLRQPVLLAQAVRSLLHKGVSDLLGTVPGTTLWAALLPAPAPGSPSPSPRG